MIKCEAEIVRTYKTAKAESRRASTATATANVCGGDITLSVSVYRGMYCGDSPDIEGNATCTKCKYPIWPDQDAFRADPVEYLLSRVNQ